MVERHIRDVKELEEVAQEVLAALVLEPKASVVTLTGDLGAGKTALTKALARVLGIEESVTSPTFVIMKSYAVTGHPFIKNLTHIDAYRIDDEDELRVIGFASILEDPHTLVVIEWPERIPNALPKDAREVTIRIGDDGERILSYGT